jgi:hypothetical protein
MKYTHAVVDNNGNVIGFSTNEKDAMFMSKNNLTKKKGTVVKLTKPMSQKQVDMKVGRKLFEGSMEDLLDEIFDDVEETNCSLRELTDDELIDCRKTLEQRLQRVLKTIINYTERKIDESDTQSKAKI